MGIQNKLQDLKYVFISKETYSHPSSLDALLCSSCVADHLSFCSLVHVWLSFRDQTLAEISCLFTKFFSDTSLTKADFFVGLMLVDGIPPFHPTLPCI